jgi:hypothetical protein
VDGGLLCLARGRFVLKKLGFCSDSCVSWKHLFIPEDANSDEVLVVLQSTAQMQLTLKWQEGVNSDVAINLAQATDAFGCQASAEVQMHECICGWG